MTHATKNVVSRREEWLEEGFRKCVALWVI
jgi:hypothetical protein